MDDPVTPPPADAPAEQTLLENRRRNLEEIRRLAGEVYPFDFPASETVSQVVRAHRDRPAEELERSAIRAAVAGRILARRTQGKAGFLDLSDGGQRLQVYVRKDAVGDAAWALYAALDLGDWIGVVGELFRTRTGELTVKARELSFLAKCLRPLPEKWHGLKDVERRYRQRYLDLAVNPESRRDLRGRARRLIRFLRRFLDGRGYLEVETPMMQPIAGGALARPFVTHHNALDIDLYLRIAPELYLKRLVVGGLERVYEINRNFRNEGISTQHNPEFTMLEFYQAYARASDLMALTEEMLSGLVARGDGGHDDGVGGEDDRLDPALPARDDAPGGSRRDPRGSARGGRARGPRVGRPPARRPPAVSESTSRSDSPGRRGSSSRSSSRRSPRRSSSSPPSSVSSRRRSLRSRSRTRAGRSGWTASSSTRRGWRSPTASPS